ncbi:MAG: hypothetical protein ACOYOV_02920 [Bacteroidales bacterium]
MKIYTLLICLILSSCVTGKIATKTSIEEIQFGYGGGFTGEFKTFTLTANCKLYEKNKELKKVDAKIGLEIFKKAEELKEYIMNEPGNMYSFIEFKTKDKTNRIVWAYGSIKVDKNVIDLQNKLLLLTK